MATLEKIRGKAGLLVGVVGLALFAFIIGDFLNSGSTFWRKSQEVVGVVDGEKITIFQYEDRVQELMNIYKMQYGEGRLNEQMTQQIRSSVWEEMVTERLFGEQTDKLGMSVTADELFDMVNGSEVYPLIQQMPMFQNPQTGEFDKGAMLHFLQTINSGDASQLGPDGATQLAQWKTYWLFYEKTMKNARLSEKYSTLFSKAITANNVEVERSMKDRSVNADIEFTYQSFASIPDSTITVTDTELKNAYAKQKERFKTPPFRSVQYLAAEIRPSESDYKEVEDRINKVKPEFETTEDIADVVNENSDSPYADVFTAVSSLDPAVQAFVNENNVGAVNGPVFTNDTYKLMRYVATTTAPDSIKVRHIYVQRATADETKALADSLVNVLKGGAEFAAICGEFSMAGTREQGGELGWMTEASALASTNKEFKDVVFTAPVNDYVQFVGGNGIQIIQVTEKTAPVQKVKVATIAMEVSPSSRTYSKLYNELNQILATANGSFEKLSQLATEKGFSFQTADMVTGESQTVGSLKESRKIVQWAFQHKKGEISEIYDCGTEFAIAVLNDINEEGYMPLKTVTATLKVELINDKKAEAIMAKLANKNFSTIAEVASELKSKVDTAKFVSFSTRTITNVGYEPALIGAAPYSELNKVSAPLKGRNGVYVFKAFNKTENPTGDVATEKSGIQMNLNGRLNYQFMPTMKSMAKIEDDRVRFF